MSKKTKISASVGLSQELPPNLASQSDCRSLNRGSWKIVNNPQQTNGEAIDSLKPQAAYIFMEIDTSS